MNNVFEKEKKLEEIAKSTFNASAVGNINPFIKKEEKPEIKLNCHLSNAYVPTVDDFKPSNQPRKETGKSKANQRRGKGRGCI